MGRLYWHVMDVPAGGPLLQLDGTSHEVEEPWRVGRCLVFRVWRKALVLGWWGPPRSYDEVLEAEATESMRDVGLGDTDVEAIRESFRPEPAPVKSSGWSVR